MSPSKKRKSLESNQTLNKSLESSSNDSSNTTTKLATPNKKKLTSAEMSPVSTLNGSKTKLTPNNKKDSGSGKMSGGILTVKNQLEGSAVSSTPNNKVVPLSETKSKKRKLKDSVYNNLSAIELDNDGDTTANNVEDTEVDGNLPKKKKKKSSKDLSLSKNDKSGDKSTLVSFDAPERLGDEDKTDLNGSTHKPKKKKSKKEKQAIINDDDLDEESVSEAKDTSKIVKAKTSPSKEDAKTKWQRKKEKIEKRKSESLPNKHPDSEKKTIFIGNVPVSTKRKQLVQFFRKYGPVESVRLRGLAAANQNTSKKEALLTNKLHPKRTSCIAYLRFKEEATVKAALEANGKEFNGNHIRVDIVTDVSNSEKTASIFIGNLAFDIEEEILHKEFAECGEIESIRVIRDSAMGSGKGIAFVNFKNKDAVEVALTHNNKMLLDRPMRVNRAMNKKYKKEKMKKNEHFHKKLRARPGVSKSDIAKSAQPKMSLNFMKKDKAADSNKSEPASHRNNFGGMKTSEIGKMKKMKKVKISDHDKKKLDAAHKLSGSNALAKKTFKKKMKSKSNVM